MPVTNFGRNVRFTPGAIVAPRNAEEVLTTLQRLRGRRIHAAGRLHSWSAACASDDVLLDLRNLRRISLVEGADGGMHVDVEAGCLIDDVLDYLAAHGGYTLPTCSMIGRQTLVGAAATGTHGAGSPSFSHYVSAATVAAYDGASPRTYEWTGGDPLRAARCALGCAGILLRVRMPVEREGLVEERTLWCDDLEQVLESEGEYPLQVCYLVPWSWKYYVQRRRALAGESDRVRWPAYAHRAARRVGVDVGLNGALRFLASRSMTSALRSVYRRTFPRMARGRLRVVDRPRALLMMRHDLYVHVEMELFVPAVHVRRAAAFVEWVLRRCGGEPAAVPAVLAGDDLGASVVADVAAMAGTYVHDHVIMFRRVLRDDTLISMSSGDHDTWYALSLITYARRREPFLRMARVVAAAMARAYGARPHWGKICPLDAGEVAGLYPALPRFRAQCRAVDPDGVFVNGFARDTLAL